MCCNLDFHWKKFPLPKYSGLYHAKKLFSTANNTEEIIQEKVILEKKAILPFYMSELSALPKVTIEKSSISWVGT